MPFTARDVIVYLNVPPWKALVKNHNGVVDRETLTTYYKATTRRNQFPGDVVVLPPGQLAGTGNGKIAPVAPLTSPLALNGVDMDFILSDAAAENAGVANYAPRPEVFTRVKLHFEVTDAATNASPYACWEDQFVILGDIDPTNELDE